MTLLALEFSSARRSVAVLDLKNGRVPPLSKIDGAPAIPCPPARMAEAIETGTGGTNAFSLIGKALAGADLTREQIEVIVVGLGPGSYTGIRVALAMAQGWQLARGVKLLGISSVEGLVAQTQAEKVFGRVQVVIDAQRNEFYLASYEISPGGWKEIQPLRIVPLAEMQSQARAGGTWVGPEVTRWLPTGKIVFPSALTLGRLAVGREDFVSGDTLTPIYLREINFTKASRTPPAI